MIYNEAMARDVSFQLDPGGGRNILEGMAAPIVRRSAEAIAGRARSMASSLSSDPPVIEVSSSVGTIRRGTRAISKVSATGSDAHQNYIGHMALAKSRDAGRV